MSIFRFQKVVPMVLIIYFNNKERDYKALNAEFSYFPAVILSTLKTS